MNRRIIILLGVLCLAFHGKAQLEENLKEQIDKIILYDTEINLEKTPGIMIGVKVQDSIYYFGYGSTSKDSVKIPDENTLFEIGGLTKVFTGSLVSLLANEGTLDLEASFNSYLPENENNTSTENITINQLLTHTSGMPRMPNEFGVKEIEQNNPYAHYTYNDLMEFYRDYIPFLDKKKKDNYLYSHLNFALLERAIQRVMKTGYEKALLQKILQPLNMSDTRVVLSENQKNRLAAGYSVSGMKTPMWKFSSFKASEGLKSTASDLMTFANAHIGDDSGFSSTFAATHIPQSKTALNKRVRAGRGWHIIKNKRYHDIIVHTGNTDGHRSYLGFVKESQTAVIVLTNSERNLEGLGYLILKMINNNWSK